MNMHAIHPGATKPWQKPRVNIENSAFPCGWNDELVQPAGQSDEIGASCLRYPKAYIGIDFIIGGVFAIQNDHQKSFVSQLQDSRRRRLRSHHQSGLGRDSAFPAGPHEIQSVAPSAGNEERKFFRAALVTHGYS